MIPGLERTVTRGVTLRCARETPQVSANAGPSQWSGDMRSPAAWPRGNYVDRFDSVALDSDARLRDGRSLPALAQEPRAKKAPAVA